ncbi:MAG: DUF3298 domain-containing protein [Lachnospiraceae bacterium]|nr:DUF3298 domain-containing protein [Lachnospiraceae bacterium]
MNKNKRIEEARDFYENIEIPKELSERVEKAIAEHPEKEERAEKKILSIGRTITAAAAAAVVCFTAALNTSEAFAKEAGELPVIGGLARVLTIRSYESHENDVNIAVRVPAVEVEENAGSQENLSEAEQETLQEGGMETMTAEQLAEQKEFTGDINAEIEKIVDEFVKKAEQDFAESKEAFFATGGTEEEWGGREMDVQTDYEVKYQKGSVLSMVLTLNEVWVAAYGEQYYYNLDLSTNRELTLKDVLGEDYQRIADETIVAQMYERAESEGYVYWGVTDTDDEIDMGGFDGVDEETKFYLNEQGNPVVCFAKYEVGPGYMGVQEFEIVK